MNVREYRDELVVRARLLLGVFVALLAVVCIGYWRIQIVHGAYFHDLAENNRLRRLPIKAPRGLIYDRNGRLLVENIPSYTLLLDRSRSRDIEGSLGFAASVLKRPETQLDAVVARYRGAASFTPVLVAENLALAEAAHFGVTSLEHPEFEVDVRHLRLYRHGAQTAHVLGYLGEVSENDLTRGGGRYIVGDLVGKKGIEQTYDQLLRGRDGNRVVVVDSRGRLLEEDEREPAVPGQSLTLTLDLDLQQEAERMMDGKVGSVVALDPRNGEILALVSEPSFDPNLFARRLDQDEWDALLNNEHHPLQNRALQNSYAPGSVFKIVMATAGLTEGVVGSDDTVYCDGSTAIYGNQFRCWKRGGHGWVNLHSALKYSCDVYFYHLGQKLGIERIAQYARMFGLGDSTGVDLRGEKAGLVPDPEWSRRERHQSWYPGETISVAIGQGPILVTPLQMARMVAVVANGGYLVTPHLVREAAIPQPVATGLDPRILANLRQQLWSVVNEEGGTGAAARLDGLDIAGKTGTSQVIAQKTWTDSSSLAYEHRDHAWFASFAPAAAPRLVVVVFVEHGGKGSAAAAPIAKALYEKYLQPDLRSNVLLGG